MDRSENINCIAIVAAAGRGERLRGATGNNPKVFFKLETKEGESSLLGLAVQRLVASKLFDKIVIACCEDYQDEARNEFKSLLKDAPPIEFIPGGETRQETVFKALKHLEGKAVRFVAIHDAARPFVSLKALESVVEEAKRSSAAVLVEPVTSTLKKLSSGQTITETHPRAEFALAQTPQVFEYELILHAHKKAAAESVIATDDSELVEALGVRPTAVFNESLNPKITELKDLELARVLARC